MFRLLCFAALLVCVISRHDGRIVGGQETTIEAFPHQVSIRINGDHSCGGSILHPRVIITAAHCLINTQEGLTTVFVGATNRKDDKSGSLHEVEKIVIYPGFSLSNLDCDVGFIKLKKAIEIRSTAQPIPLVAVDNAPRHGDILLGTGWGRTSADSFVIPDILRVAILPVIDLEMCKDAHGRDSVASNTLTENMFCAGGSVNGQATYQGDSGGPIMNKNGELVGLSSWGKAGNPTGYPKVFTNLCSPKVRQFINKFMATMS